MVGLRIRKGSQQHSVHHTEDSGIGANAEAERQHRHGDEAGILRQHAQAEL